MGPATQGVDKGRNAKIAAFPLLTYRSRCIAMLARFSCDACLVMLRDYLMSRPLASACFRIISFSIACYLKDYYGKAYGSSHAWN